MGLGFKALSMLKNISQNLGHTISSESLPELGCFGYQQITLSKVELTLLLGSDAVSEALVRIDVYGLEGCRTEEVHSIPLKDFYKIFSNLSLLAKLNLDHDKILAAFRHEKFVIDADYIFKKIGLKHTAIDLIPHTGKELIQDLCIPVDKTLHNKFTVILDGGTMEHCFNVPQVFSNIVNMLDVNGVVFHVSPLTWPNHGFYNFNPCLFSEFYQANGFSVLHSLHGFNYGNRPLEPISTTTAYSFPPENTLLFFVAKKLRQVDAVCYPVQGVYKKFVSAHRG